MLGIVITFFSWDEAQYAHLCVTAASQKRRQKKDVRHVQQSTSFYHLNSALFPFSNCFTTHKNASLNHYLSSLSRSILKQYILNQYSLHTEFPLVLQADDVQANASLYFRVGTPATYSSAIYTVEKKTGSPVGTSFLLGTSVHLLLSSTTASSYAPLILSSH